MYRIIILRVRINKSRDKIVFRGGRERSQMNLNADDAPHSCNQGDYAGLSVVLFIAMDKLSIIVIMLGWVQDNFALAPQRFHSRSLWSLVDG